MFVIPFVAICGVLMFYMFKSQKAHPRAWLIGRLIFLLVAAVFIMNYCSNHGG